MARPKRKLGYGIHCVGRDGLLVSFRRVYTKGRWAGAWKSSGSLYSRTFASARRIARRLVLAHGGSATIERDQRIKGKRYIVAEWTITAPR